MAFTEDLSAFFSTDEFAVQTTLAGVAVRGIFDNGFVQAQLGSAGMASSQPTLTIPTAIVPPGVINWFAYFTEPFDPMDLELQIAGATYRVVAHEPDGTGVSVLLLEKVAP